MKDFLGKVLFVLLWWPWLRWERKREEEELMEKEMCDMHGGWKL